MSDTSLVTVEQVNAAGVRAAVPYVAPPGVNDAVGEYGVQLDTSPDGRLQVGATRKYVEKVTLPENYRGYNWIIAFSDFGFSNDHYSLYDVANEQSRSIEFSSLRPKHLAAARAGSCPTWYGWESNVVYLQQVVAYNAETTLEKVLDRIPHDVAAEVDAVLVCDDASADATHEVALAYQRTNDRLPLHIVRHPVNLGYGGNQKAGYQLAAEMGLDVVVLLHGDGQYAPELMAEMVKPIVEDGADAVFGSRMMNSGAAREGGMPLYKYVGNKILTRYENAMTGASLTEWHSGYRAYRVSTLQKIALAKNSDG
ncbi:MAG: glycosyltransferase family 2 protein, partial [Actinobacteria bacterium]|nr:glycosyltransferase family 2 protein [Actinomycetota bacterium]